MKEKIKIVVVGCGRFAKNFVPLFKAHPAVEKVYVCDQRRERAEDYAQKFDVEIIDSFEETLNSDKVNSVAIFTQRFAHGKMAIAALKAGKHVYSAVPCAIDIDEIIEIESLVRQTRLTYSMGETGFYRAAAIFCRNEFEKGTFGKFVYGEAHYNHDIRMMEILNRYRLDCMTLNRDVVLVRGDEKRYGYALDIDSNGALVVRFEDGHLEAVNSGEISVRGMYGYV